MHPSYYVFLGTILLLIVAIILLMTAISKRRSSKQKDQMLQLAKDLNISIYEGEPLKSKRSLVKLIKHPQIIEGNYRGRAVKIFPFISGIGRNIQVKSAIRILGPNRLSLSFTIVNNTWVQNFWKLIGRNPMILGDAVFDSQFVVKASKPEAIQKILTDTLRAKFVSVRKNFGYKGGIELEDESMVYLEHQAITREHQRKRFEAMVDLMCCLRDEIDVYSRGS